MSYPKYVSHKEVTAAKIKLVDPCSDGGVSIELEGFPTVTFSHLQMRSKPRPEAGWYLVQYADGYVSFSPAQAFEDGYALVDSAADDAAKGELKELESYSHDVKGEEPAEGKPEELESYTHAEGDFAGDDDPYGIRKEYGEQSAASPGSGEHKPASE